MKLNTVICGDIFNVMPNIADKSIDMILTDMPYNTTACDWDKEVIPLDKLWEGFKRIIKDNGAIVMTASQPFTSKLVMSNLKMFKYCWVWLKTKASGHLDAKRKPMKKHEDILVFCRNGFPNYYPQGLKVGEYKTGRNVNMNGKVYSKYKNHGTSTKGNYPKTTLEIANPSNIDNLHPTQKPVALFEYLIKTYTSVGDLVFDGFAGSGTTCVAAKNLHRNFIGIEKEEKYCEIGRNRLRQGVLNI